MTVYSGHIRYCRCQNSSNRSPSTIKTFQKCSRNSTGDTYCCLSMVSITSSSSVPLPLLSESRIVFLIEQKSNRRLLPVAKSLQAQTTFVLPLIEKVPSSVFCALIPIRLKMLLARCSLMQLLVYDKFVGFRSPDGEISAYKSRRHIQRQSCCRLLHCKLYREQWGSL